MLNEIHLDPIHMRNFLSHFCQQHFQTDFHSDGANTLWTLVRKWYAKISLQFWVFVCERYTLSLSTFFLAFFLYDFIACWWRKTTRSFCNRLLELCSSLHLNTRFSVMDDDYGMNACASVIWKMATKNVLKGYHLPLENINHLKLVHTPILTPFCRACECSSNRYHRFQRHIFWSFPIFSTSISLRMELHQLFTVLCYMIYLWEKVFYTLQKFNAKKKFD